MHSLNETNLLVFLVQVCLLLGLSRLFGMLLAKAGQPSITGEILVGLLLGPTVLGRVAPGMYLRLFPDDPIQFAMLEAVAWLGILFFLLVTGLETDLATAWRQRKDGTVISVSDLVIPVVVAFFPCLLLPSGYLVDPGQRILFALFVATIMTISALPVTARILQDLNIYRSDVGLLIMCALTINDVAGWIVFAVILGATTEGRFDAPGIIGIVVATFVFAGAFLTIGRGITNRLIQAMQRRGFPEPGASLTLICLLGLLGGVITLRIGIHALFGFFIAGIMAGEAKALPEKTRTVIGQMVRAVLVPIFFATIGLQVDFLKGFDIGLILFILVVGIAGRYIGAWVGSALTGNFREHRQIIAIAHVPGGEMQIVIGMLALEFNVISETVFVAIVVGAIVTSIICGPWMHWALRRVRRADIASFIHPETCVVALAARTRDDAIRELCAVAAMRARIDAGTLARSVLDRESAMGTALGGGVAAPHARLEMLSSPLLAIGRSPHGIEWNAPDGVPAEFVFLILTPAADVDAQLRILRAIAQAMRNPEHLATLRNAPARDAFADGLLSILRVPAA